MATLFNNPFQQKPEPGFRLVDGRSMWDAIVNNNGISTASGIAAAGTTRATATPLTAVLNQVDTAAASSGVNLPLSTGPRATPYNFCIVINNGANPLKVYGAQTGSDTINGISGTTGITQVVGDAVLYVSAKNGAWFALDAFNSIPSGLTGTFVATGSSVTVTNANITANSTVTFGLKTVGGTIAGAPFMLTVTPGTGFTVNAGASDTSTYNYTIIG